jgi:hypothetical protein
VFLVEVSQPQEHRDFQKNSHAYSFGALDQGLGYFVNHQLALTRFLDDGRLPIDNGIVERLHRRPAVRTCKFMFGGSHADAERAAIAYSLLATCTLRDISPTRLFGRRIADARTRPSRVTTSPR